MAFTIVLNLSSMQKKKNLNTKYNSEDLDVKKISKHGIN